MFGVSVDTIQLASSEAPLAKSSTARLMGYPLIDLNRIERSSSGSLRDLKGPLVAYGRLHVARDGIEHVGANDDVRAPLGLLEGAARRIGVLEAPQHGEVVAAVTIDRHLVIGKAQLPRKPGDALRLGGRRIGYLEHAPAEGGIHGLVRMGRDEGRQALAPRHRPARCDS